MRTFSRRQAIEFIGMGIASVSMLPTMAMIQNERKRHLITLSFDDGFKKSSVRTAEIFEKYKLSACINVIATAHLPGFELPSAYHAFPVGDFVLWNELQDRGHEIMMHGYKHAHKNEIQFNEAKSLIMQCIEVFTKELKGFNPKNSIFNFPFNASTSALEEWLPSQVKAFRTGGPPINKLPHKGQSKLTCTSFGPENIDKHLSGEIEKLLANPSGWLIYNTHGLDEEGWGPMTSDFLDRLLGRLVEIDSVEIIPAGEGLSSI